MNKRRIGTSHRLMPKSYGPNISNLPVVNTKNNHNQEGACNNMRIATLNARSGKNKDHLIVQQLHETDTDIAVITETWLKDTDIDDTWLNQSELRQSNYNILLQNRLGPKKSGSMALMYKHQYRNSNTLLEKTTTSTMEYLICRLVNRNKPYHIIGLYHPPPNTNNQTTASTFIDEITSLLTERIPNPSNIMILETSTLIL